MVTHARPNVTRMRRMGYPVRAKSTFPPLVTIGCNVVSKNEESAQGQDLSTVNGLNGACSHGETVHPNTAVVVSYLL